MEPNDVTKTGRTRRPVWPIIVITALVLLLVVLVGRSCRQDYGGLPAGIPDSLNADPGDPAVPAADDPNDRMPQPDTALDDPEVLTPAVAPQAPAGSPTTPGGGPGS